MQTHNSIPQDNYVPSSSSLTPVPVSLETEPPSELRWELLSEIAHRADFFPKKLTGPSLKRRCVRPDLNSTWPIYANARFAYEWMASKRIGLCQCDPDDQYDEFFIPMRYEEPATLAGCHAIVNMALDLGFGYSEEMLEAVTMAEWDAFARQLRQWRANQYKGLMPFFFIAAYDPPCVSEAYRTDCFMRALCCTSAHWPAGDVRAHHGPAWVECWEDLSPMAQRVWLLLKRELGEEVAIDLFTKWIRNVDPKIAAEWLLEWVLHPSGMHDKTPLTRAELFQSASAAWRKICPDNRPLFEKFPRRKDLISELEEQTI